METDNLIYKIALAYYEKGMTQQEIAHRYGISRIKVSRLLNHAQKGKIVQIKIIPPKDPYVKLETLLEDKYGLDQLIIAGGSGGDFATWVDQAGKVAADYFTSILAGTETVGLTWGRALLSFVNSLPPMNYPDLKIVQMLGGLGEPQSEFHGADLCRKMAQACGTRPWLIQAPGIVRDGNICKALKEDFQVKGTLELAARADIVVVGIGYFGEKAPLNKSNTILSPQDKTLLTMKGAVGDISLRFFNRDGDFIPNELDDRVVGLTAAEIGKLKRIIGIAGGMEKYDTIRAAVSRKLIHVLITDLETAKRLAKEPIQ